MVARAMAESTAGANPLRSSTRPGDAFDDLKILHNGARDAP
jgi:hypothetical protein